MVTMAIGEVAATAKKIMFTVPTKTEEDDLAGVSVLMKNVPGSSDNGEASEDKTIKKKTSKTKAKRSRRSKK